MNARDFLRQTVTVEIDRPLGSRHPEWGFIYPVNYGYLAGVPAPDGEELDAYVLGVFEPLARYEGRCIAVIHRLDILPHYDCVAVMQDGRIVESGPYEDLMARKGALHGLVADR